MLATEGLQKYGLKIIAVIAGYIAGWIRCLDLDKWTMSELDGTASMLLQGILDNDPEVLAALEKSYKETGGELFKEKETLFG